MRYLFPHLPHVRMDPLATAMLFAYPLPLEGRTPVEGVRVVPRGSFVALPAPRAGPRRSGTYWDPRPDTLRPPTAARFREHAVRLREVLLGRLTADLDPTGGNLLALSGGVDSTSLLCLSAGTLGLPVSALTLTPPQPEAVRHERRYLSSALERAPVVRHWTPRNHGLDRLAIARRMPGMGFPRANFLMHHLPEVVERSDVRVFFGGEFGDELGGAHVSMPDWVDTARLSRVLIRLGGLPYGPQDALRWVKWRAQRAIRRPHVQFPAEFFPWFHPAVRAEYRDVAAAVRRRLLTDRQPLRWLAQRTTMDGWLLVHWEASSEAGVRRSFPFFNREALELVFDCHPGELVGPGMRRLERAALVEDVPALNLGRTDRGQWQREGWAPVPFEGRLPEGLEPLLDPSWFPRPERPVDPGIQAVLWIMARFARSLDPDPRPPEHEPSETDS